MTFRNVARCPECGRDNSRVTDTRQTDDRSNATGTIKRLRVCADCGTNWRTIEIDLTQAAIAHESQVERNRCKQIILDEIERWNTAEQKESIDNTVAYAIAVGALSNVLCRVMELKIADEN